MSVNIEQLFTRKNVEELGDVCRVLDKDEETGVELFSYAVCGDDDSEILKGSRGIVFDGEKLVMKGFPHTYERTTEDAEFDLDLSQVKIFDANEGTIIRVFHYGGKWFVSTNRKLDADKSKWVSKTTFGELFREAVHNELINNPALAAAGRVYNNDPATAVKVLCDNVLDSKKQYMFLLLNNTENRFVCDGSNFATIYHVGTISNFELDTDDDIGIIRTQQHKFAQMCEVYAYVENIDYTKKQGVVIVHQDGRHFKLYNREYKALYDARGNEPSINFRYLQVRNDPDLVKMLEFLYPTNIPVFQEYEGYINDTINLVHKAYVQRYIENQFIVLNPEEYKIMRDTHDWYKKEKGRAVSKEIVAGIVDAQNASLFNRIIKRIKFEKKTGNVAEPKVRLLKK